MLVSMEVILKKASAENYGVVAPNIYNMETVKAAFEAASELKSPLILDCLDSLELEAIAEISRYYSEKYPAVVAALNLDHGKSFATAVRAIRAGFTSVMVDRSQLALADNIRETAEITKMAHAVGVSVEAELGHVGFGVEYEKARDAGLTRVEEAIEFVEKTSVDCLAVAVGTAHGRYIGTPKLDFERLAEIRRKVKVPLVLHGGSSTGDENLKRAVETGIAKVNISTDLKAAAVLAADKYLRQEEHPDYIKMLTAGKNGWKEMLMHYMELFGSVNKG